MHTSAHITKADDIRLEHEGQVIEPVSLECDPRTGAHSLRIVMRPTGCINKRVIAHVPIERGEAHTLAASKLADRINRAAKQGHDAIQVSHRSQDAVLVLQRATLVAHEEPERQETNPPKTEKVADLFEAAAA
jgi:hypothetical protein